MKDFLFLVYFVFFLPCFPLGERHSSLRCPLKDVAGNFVEDMLNGYHKSLLFTGRTGGCLSSHMDSNGPKTSESDWAMYRVPTR